MLVAHDATGDRVEASRLLAPAAYVCPECRGPVIFKRGRVKVPHFAHAPGAECSSAGESIRHLMAKTILAEEFRRCGYEVVLEERYPDASRRVDVAVTVRNTGSAHEVIEFEKFAVEVQDSAISTGEMTRRVKADFGEGFASTIWVWVGGRAAPILGVPQGGEVRVTRDVLRSTPNGHPARCLDVETRQMWSVSLEKVVRSGAGLYPDRKLKMMRTVRRRVVGFAWFDGWFEPYVARPRPSKPDPDGELAERLRELCEALEQASALDDDQDPIVSIETLLSVERSLGWTREMFEGLVLQIGPKSSGVLIKAGLPLLREPRGDRLRVGFAVADLRDALNRPAP